MYWIYENWTHDRARIHAATCGHCNNGEGREAQASDRNGRWLGPFELRADADHRLMRLGRSSSGYCGHCSPHSVNSLPARTGG